MTRATFNALGNANLAAAAIQNLAVNGFNKVSQENGDNLLTRAANVGGYVTDQWIGNFLAVPSTTQRVTDAPPGCVYSLKFTVTTGKASLAAGDYCGIETLFEGARMMDLKWGGSNAIPLVVGFWWKSSAAGTYYAGWAKGDTSRSYNKKFVYPTPNVWQFVPLAYLTPDQAGAWVSDSSRWGYFRVCVAAGSNLYGAVDAPIAGNLTCGSDITNNVAVTGTTFQITGLVIIPGTELPPAEMWPYLARQYVDELPLCQRYWNWTDIVLSSSQGYQQMMTYPVEMRTIPALTFTVGAGTGAGFNPYNNKMFYQTTTHTVIDLARVRANARL